MIVFAQTTEHVTSMIKWLFLETKWVGKLTHARRPFYLHTRQVTQGNAEEGAGWWSHGCIHCVV